MDDNSISSRFIQDVEKQLHLRKHVILYGNIHDQFLWRGNYVTVDSFLSRYFRDLGFNLVGNYDPVDGFLFADQDEPHFVHDPDRKVPEKMEPRFQDLVHRCVAANQPPLPPPGQALRQAGEAAVGAAKNVASAIVAPVRTMPGQPGQQGPGAMNGQRRRVSPEDAYGSIRMAVSQPNIPVAFILDQIDMLSRDSGNYDSAERPAMILLMKCLLDSAVITQGALRGYRNSLVMKAADLKRVPEWLYFDNPYVALVQATRPNKDERRQYALAFARPGSISSGFFGGDKLIEEQGAGPEHELARVAEEFADLTEGLQAIDLEGLRITSWNQKIPLKGREVWRLVDFFKFGIRTDPWEALSPEKVRTATDVLTKRVMGQPRAVEAVTNMLTTARMGLSMTGSGGRSARPRGIFFFVGPTGVGKTELAKAMTQLVFGDERAFARFDMSEYKEEHAAEKLAGAPPGFVGYQEGGQLTNRVMEQPHSILLFDEIEKAHPKVLDKFLQILEDGRLTDGKGQTAYFNQTAIIFTSNIGASDLSDPQTGAVIRQGIMSRVRLDNSDSFPYEEVANHFRSEVDWFFTSRIGRAELLSRLGDNIVAFDLLRPEFVDGIASKFLGALIEAAMEKYQLRIVLDQSVIEITRKRMTEGDNLLFGGRRIKSLLESIIERPLNRYLFEKFPDPTQLAGKTIRLGLSDEGQLETTLV